MIKLNTKIIKRFGGLLLTLATVFFSYNYITALVNDANFSKVDFTWYTLLLAILFFTGYYCFMSLNWLLSAKLFKPDVTNNQFLVFLASQPYKYLPTSLFVFSSRAIYGKRLGLTYKQSTVAQVLENASIFFSNIVVFVFFYSLIYWRIVSLLLLLVLFIGFYLLYKKNIIKIKFKNNKFSINTIVLIRMLSYSTTGWLFCGISFILLTMSLGFSVEGIKLIAANTIAFLLSIVAFFAPGGIGIRELVYSYFGIVGVVIIYWRILVFIMDMLIGLPAILYIRKINKLNK